MFFWIFIAIYVLILLLTVFLKLRDVFETKEQLCARLEKYSDPTDKDYIAKMPSDVSPEVALGVRRILVDVGGVEADEVWPETNLTDLL